MNVESDKKAEKKARHSLFFSRKRQSSSFEEIKQDSGDDVMGEYVEVAITTIRFNAFSGSFG